MAICIAQDEHADRVLEQSPFALLTGMLLDQQFPMERAFAGPAKILDRFGSLDPARIAEADPDEFAALCAQPPAVHRFPGSMSTRVRELAATVVADYEGRAELLWEQAADGPELLRRLRALPGFGPQKAQIFVALLAKQRGVRPTGWEAVAGAYAEDGCYRSVADVVDGTSLERVRADKRERKRAARG
ncbi:MAG: HhH-GPD-type base excision DNA repair protein [Nocardioidaceae bacterium]